MHNETKNKEQTEKREIESMFTTVEIKEQCNKCMQITFRSSFSLDVCLFYCCVWYLILLCSCSEENSFEFRIHSSLHSLLITH